MTWVAFKMLLGDRPKYGGLLFGVTFTAFLVTFAAAYFSGMMTRSFALIADNAGADVWVMDPAVSAVDQAIGVPTWALNRVRSTTGVSWATPLLVAHADVRLPNGRFQNVEVLGLDEATLTGLPPLRSGGSPERLRSPDAVVVDAGGTAGKLDTPALPRDQWPWRTPHLDAPERELAAGDDVLLNDNRLHVVGRSDGRPRFPPRPIFFTTFRTAQRVLPAEHRRTTFVLARVAAGASASDVARRIERETGLRARTKEEFKADTVRWLLVNSEDVGDAVTMLSIALLVGFGVTAVMMFMFTHQNLRFYAVLNAMGVGSRTLLGMAFLQAGLCGFVGAGLGVGLCVLGGRVFTAHDFPFRMMWFAPVTGLGAIVLICAAAAALTIRPILTLQPSKFLSGR